MGLLQHILFIHGPYFAVQGPLATWSTQGMEKSHYQACTSFFRNTRHGGGQIKSNALKEVFNWFYRRQFKDLYQKNMKMKNQQMKIALWKKLLIQNKQLKTILIKTTWIQYQQMYTIHKKLCTKSNLLKAEGWKKMG